MTEALVYIYSFVSFEAFQHFHLLSLLLDVEAISICCSESIHRSPVHCFTSFCVIVAAAFASLVFVSWTAIMLTDSHSV